MQILIKLAKIVPLILLAFAAGVPLFGLPATLSLPRGQRPGVHKLTIEQAAQQLRANGSEAGWARVEAARALVGQRMQYSRRNSFDSAERAFERGYGYCMQHAYALARLLHELGFQAQVVQAFQNRFAGGKVTSHAWVRVTLDGETRDIDPLFWDTEAGRTAFTPLSPVTRISPAFRAFTWWGAPAVNAFRYYRTGKDL
jgi:transglutaminase-like putative cysteine protease